MTAKALVSLGLLAISLCGFSQKPKTNGITIGIKGGVNLAGMLYTDSHLSSLPQETDIKPVVGVFVDIPLTYTLDFVPELLYVERGMKTIYLHYSGNEVRYELSSRYVDVRLPLLFGPKVTPHFQPYIIAGADVGYLLGGNICLYQPWLPSPNTTIKMGKANMYPFYIGAFAGLGMRLLRVMNGRKAQFRIDAIYNMDFVDSFSVMEHADASHPVNVNAYNITGKRFPRGIEVTMGLVVPLRPDKNNACYGFSKNKWNSFSKNKWNSSSKDKWE